jgi:hypothetical protein
VNRVNLHRLLLSIDDFLSAGNRSKILLVVIFLILYCCLIWIIYPGVPNGKDYIYFFRPAIQELIRGSSPYNINGFVSPPWTLLPLLPLAILPDKLASAILVVSCPFIFAAIAFRMGAKIPVLIAIAFSSPVIHCAFNINIDWLPTLGILMPPQLGLFFVFMKPQIGIGVAVYWLIQAWREGRWLAVFKIYWPVTIGFLLSFTLYGFWPLRTAEMANVWWNTSLFPWSVPLGLGFLLIAVIRRQKNISLVSSPLLSPYLSMQSWSGMLIGLIAFPRFALLVSILTWVITFYMWYR